MNGLFAVLEKELADNLGSRRFLLLFTIICFTGLAATWGAGQAIRSAVSEAPQIDFVFLRLFTAQSGQLPSFTFFIYLLGPLIGIALGFDAINSERSRGTLSRILSQPVYRDAVINGKFLAGLTTIGLMLAAIMLIVSGLGLRLIGVPPTLDEALRLIAFWALSVVFVAFWMGVAMLFSILIRQTATSALASLGVWFFFLLFMPMIAGMLGSIIVPVGLESPPQLLIMREEVVSAISRVSPNTLYAEALGTILDPSARKLGPLYIQEVIGMLPTPLSFTQSLLVVWPHLVSLVALTLICFAISYVRFMREEIRSS
jgi:ABC-2 type transport system permease protein